jgi:hypothetical protein
MNHVIEFIAKMIIFAFALFFIIEYVFACQVHNTVGIMSLSLVIATVLILFWFFGNKKRIDCKK